MFFCHFGREAFYFGEIQFCGFWNLPDKAGISVLTSLFRYHLKHIYKYIYIYVYVMAI